MTEQEFIDRLAARARHAKVDLPTAIVGSLQAYFRLLARWNSTINLTSLSLDPPTIETFDRLLVEPLAAARDFPEGPNIWFDLGSGGGSPAIPLKIARPTLTLTMIESKARKAAFLQEVVRSLGLRATSVLNQRFEDVARDDKYARRADLVTVRAVRADAGLFSSAAQLLRDGGEMLIFGSTPPSQADLTEFEGPDTVELLSGASSFLTRFRRK